MKKGNRVWGIFLLVIAIAIFLTATGILNVPAFVGISTGKIVWTVILGVMFFGSLATQSYEGMIIAAGVLFKMYEDYLGIHISIPILILVMILLIVALNYIFPEKSGHHDRPNGGMEVYTENENAEYIYVKTRFNGIAKYIESKRLREVEVNAAYGGCELYMTKADALNGEITMNLNVKGAGMDVYIPRNWRVVNDADLMMSGYDEDPIVLDEGEASPVTLHLIGKVRQSGMSVSRNTYNEY